MTETKTKTVALINLQLHVHLVGYITLNITIKTGIIQSGDCYIVGNNDRPVASNKVMKLAITCAGLQSSENLPVHSNVSKKTLFSIAAFIEVLHRNKIIKMNTRNNEIKS